MSKLIPSQFCRYELDTVEILQGSILSPLQQQCIQNQIADLAKEKIELTYSVKDPQEYWQREAELQGSIRSLQYLLAVSEGAAEELRSHRSSEDATSHSAPQQPEISPNQIFEPQTPQE